MCQKGYCPNTSSKKKYREIGLAEKKKQKKKKQKMQVCLLQLD